MMISTKGRYALRVMIDLAQNDKGVYISLKDVAARQDISMKYLEMIVSLLNKGNVIISQRGKEGGYRLSRPADSIAVDEIMKLTEGTLAPVQCLAEGSGVCMRSSSCITLPMWKELDNIVENYLSGISIQDLIDGKVSKNSKTL